MKVAQHEVRSLSDADFRQKDRIVSKLAIGSEQPIIFGYCVGEVVPALGVHGKDLRPRRRQEDLPMVDPSCAEALPQHQRGRDRRRPSRLRSRETGGRSAPPRLLASQTPED
jgi:hypothetical protein